MTINEALSRTASETGKGADREKLLSWLWELEETAGCEVFSSHGTPTAPESITADSDGERILLIPDPYSEIYVLYLRMKNDLYIGDINQYAVSSKLFSSAYRTFADKYNRENMSCSEQRIRL